MTSGKIGIVKLKNDIVERSVEWLLVSEETLPHVVNDGSF